MIKHKNSNQKNPANFDNEKGIGSSKYHWSKEYDSVEVLMKPSIFLKLAYPFYENNYPSGFEYIIDHINKELPIATPYLIIIKLGMKHYQVEGHEGRHRTTVIKNKYGDIPSRVLLIFENFFMHDLTETLNNINRGIYSEKNEYIKGPIFDLTYYEKINQT